THRNQDVVKHRQNRRGAVHPLEPEGNIYQHACQSIEGYSYGLIAKFATNLRADDFRVANGERRERIIVFECGDDARRCAAHLRKVVDIREHAILVSVTIGEQRLGQLLILVAGAHGKRKRIFLRQVLRQGSGCGGIEILFSGAGNTIGSIESAENLGLGFVERLIALPNLCHEDQDLVGVRVGNITDALDLAIAQTLGSQAVPELFDIGRLGETYVHVGATPKIDAVLNSAVQKNGGPAKGQ